MEAITFWYHNRRLNRVVKELTAAVEVVQETVDADLKNNRLIRPRVQTWLTRAAAVQAQATQLKDKAAAINSSSSSWIKGCCSLSSSEVEDMVDVTKKLLIETWDFMFITLPYFEEYRVFIDFPSRKATAERVMVALKKDEIRLVGLYGMPGVGKTMLIQALSQQAKKDQIFDEVVTVSLSSQSLDLRRIQDDVAMQLDLILEENESDISRAESISQRLLQHTSVLVVLDNLWERVELEKLGISLGEGGVGERCCCKVVFTTRDQNLCDEMENDEKIQVVRLSKLDSWSLFRQNAGGYPSWTRASSSDFQAAATDVLNKCKGLPLAIVTLGITFRHIKRREDWERAVVQLRKWIDAGMGPITSSIRLSLDWLHGTNVFLFCCLFPKDFKIEIEVLLWYMMGDRLFRYEYSFLGQARSMLDDYIGYLASSPLLLYDKEDLKHVWMNDVVRDAAKPITSDHGFLVKDGMTLTAGTDTELHYCKRLFVMGTKVSCGRPDLIMAPNLLTLSLNGYNDLNEIPPDFFTVMPRLRVLDLSNTNIESLPRSLPRLMRLRTLLMKNCRKLKDVSLIEKLENLIILDLSGSNIQRLPKVKMANLIWFHM